jgi:Zn-dependent membrane protease YugP
MIIGTWKFVLMAEPLFSTLITFGSIWGIRFIAPEFAYITMISGILMYITYYVMVGIMLYELLFYSEKR